MVDAMSGRSSSRKGKFLKAATQAAVEKQYDVARGNHRLHAALKGEVEIEDSQTMRSFSDGPSTEMVVRYKRERSWVEETVTAVPRAVLQGVLNVILMESEGEAGQEHVKPHNLAQTSPRVFWSIYRHFGSDFEAALAELLPNVDLTFLGARTKRLSEKAIENKRQAEHGTGSSSSPSSSSSSGGAGGEGEGGGEDSEVVQEGSGAVGSGSQPSGARGRAAALEGLQRGDRVVEYALSQLNGASGAATSGGAEQSRRGSEGASATEAMGNSGDGVDAADDDEEEEEGDEDEEEDDGAGAREKCGMSRAMLAATEPSDVLEACISLGNGASVTLSDVEGWVGEAQMDELDEAMMRIVPLDAVRESLGRLGVLCPRDLTRLRYVFSSLVLLGCLYGCLVCRCLVLLCEPLLNVALGPSPCSVPK